MRKQTTTAENNHCEREKQTHKQIKRERDNSSMWKIRHKQTREIELILQKKKVHIHRKKQTYIHTLGKIKTKQIWAKIGVAFLSLSKKPRKKHRSESRGNTY